MKYLILGLGGFIGVNLRYLLQTWAAGRWGPDFPYGTLLINVVGSFLLAVFVTLATTRLIVSPNLRLFVAVGLLGGFTTFSSFTVETFERFAYPVPAVADLPASARDALLLHLASGEPIRQMIYSPGPQGLPRGRRYGPGLRYAQRQAPATVLVLTEERLLTATLLEGETAPPVTVTPLADLLRLELGTILLFSWIEWSWASAAALEVHRVYFNTAGERLFWELLTALRRAVSAQSDLPVQAGQPKEDAFDALPYKFANIVPNRLMLPDEQVQAMVYQPTIWRRRFGIFKRRRGPATTVVLSPQHLLVAQEDAPVAGAAYGMIARYCPRSRLAGMTLERAENDLWLTVVARWRGVEESWRVLFQPAAEPALQALVRQAALP